ncbi:tyrosine-type recombinase/integrase [Zobellia uliginosa]|uniref:tyrosine-type recombinase/integrase n=1 Tax=Zobellia uliginosa TaxID=143224 RepID=UPI001C07AEED|nr:phage integrase SAM-like domain-containing protein [Zobellia uliginosa]MBU2948046.1 site-specific integrase [Zobellia uliginosa]
MASIKFYPHLKRGESKIYIRLSLKRGQDFRLSTGLTIKDAQNWNFNKNLPKPNSDDNKKLSNSLKDLESHLDTKLYDVERDKMISLNDITSRWVKKEMLDFFNETVEEVNDLLIPYAYSYAEGLKSKTFQRNGRRKNYTDNTISKYLNFAKQLENFQSHRRISFKIKDVDDNFVEQFLEYLTEEKNLAVNTKGRYIKRLKSIIADAEINGQKTNPKYKTIKGFEDETVVTFLTLDELDTIIETTMNDSQLEIAKDWLIIGCFTGQRISDLFRMNKNMITNYERRKYISFSQFKTGKKVMIPIHYHVQDIIDKYKGNFPPNLYKNEKSNRTQLSGLMKTVCRNAGIKDNVKGRYNGVIGIYPKYKLIQNHTCRRSFASNFYGKEGWTTPMIMEITGHMTEKNFLKYIDKDQFFLSQKAAENFDAERMKRKSSISGNLKAV